MDKAKLLVNDIESVCPHPLEDEPPKALNPRLDDWTNDREASNQLQVVPSLASLQGRFANPFASQSSALRPATCRPEGGGHTESRKPVIPGMRRGYFCGRGVSEKQGSSFRRAEPP
jgi:hypothetical protein